MTYIKTNSIIIINKKIDKD